jgi:hypothetical protein
MKNEEVTLILAGGNLSLPFLENVIKEYAGATIIAADRGLEALFSEGTFCLTFINSGSCYENVVESGNSFYYPACHTFLTAL